MSTRLISLLLSLCCCCFFFSQDIQAAPSPSSLNRDAASNIIRLQRSKADLQTSSHALRAAHLSGNTALHATGASFLASITIGSTTFLNVIDTGSSDTWVASSNFSCVNIYTNATKAQSQCSFGKTYAAASDAQFQPIAGENFNVTYGDGEYLTGVFGSVPVTLAGVRVPAQQVALATLAAWQGDGQASGIIGLAYPALTDAYPGSDPRVDRYCSPGATAQNSGCNQIEYSGLVNTMFFQDQLTAAPVFALALSRDASNQGDGGYLSIGKLPPLDAVGVKDQRFASTPIKVLPGDDRFRYYLIAIDGLVMLPVGTALPPEKRDSDAQFWSRPGRENPEHGRRRSSSTTKTVMTTSSASSRSVTPSSTYAVTSDSAAEYILDSGTTLSFFPSAMARKFNSMFSPPATLDSSTGFYFVQCTASTPPLGVNIGGMVFFHNPKDLVKRYDSTHCISGIQDANRLGGINILGDVFLDNVLAVFNLTQGDNRVWFASRRDYSS